MPNTAYSTAKFAVKGFSEALIEDLRCKAPSGRVAVVMPGHVGTDIIANSLRARGLPAPEHMSHAQVEELIPPDVRAELIRAGALPAGASAEQLRRMLVRANTDFRDKARSARLKRRPSSSTGCDPGPGRSSSARTPR